MSDAFNLYPLYVFGVVARLGSVTRAAQELLISQPAVSAHVKALEARYGVPLCERTPRGVLLTSAGDVLARHANRVFALLEDIGTAVEATRREVTGRVTVAASSTPGAYLAPRLLRGFQDLYPRAEVTLLVGDSNEVISLVRDFQVPLGIVGETDRTDGLYREEVGQDELRLVVAAADPLADIEEIGREELAGRTLFLRESGSSTRAGAEALLHDYRPDFGRVVVLRSTEAIKQSVGVGLGVAVLSSWTTELEEQAGVLRPVRDTRFRRTRRFFAVRREDRLLTGVVAALWERFTAPAGCVLRPDGGAGAGT